MNYIKNIKYYNFINFWAILELNQRPYAYQAYALTN